MEMNVNLRGSTFNLVADYYESYAPPVPGVQPLPLTRPSRRPSDRRIACPSVFDLLVANRLYGYLILGIR